MNDYIDKVFDMLGIKPNEEFYIQNRGHMVYKITPDLDIYYRYPKGSIWSDSALTIKDILKADYRLIKTPKISTIPSEQDLIVINYFRLCNYKYLAKDKDGMVFAYKYKPIKNEISWTPSTSEDEIIATNVDVSCVFWEDDFPFYIGE